MNFNIIIRKVNPAYNDVRRSVHKLRISNPYASPNELSRLYIKKIRNKYTSVGAVTALPGIIPGLGTTTQAVIEAGSLSTDLILMLRWMAGVCYGTSLIYGKDIEKEFEAEFITVLAIWSGVLTKKSGRVEHFDKYLSDKLRNRMHQKIGKELMIKYGSKRGTSSLGKFIPFGIGAVIGGAFNYTTMKKFGLIADNYFNPYMN
ncbi:MAG: hypothetical protein BM557_10495 [Flavobacterium sp. MedPE-SWcel]|uniref:EcsC family protein n=1 Tax=uncultured Flavobacterium sp. TaxID=165435 RepID=UPI00091E296A|nr:EcsC family protein [uncultured Flavobacterium sp.]OIQ16292.1 MAG: hypothetical protein BM557_10495 [Flavobacterium sp. MedPE-SWcel]